jgi:hypothetical protein
MAREVNTVLAQILAEGRGVSEAKGEEIVKNMRAANQYQVREEIWLFLSKRLLTSVCRRMSGHEKGALAKGCMGFSAAHLSGFTTAFSPPRGGDIRRAYMN